MIIIHASILSSNWKSCWFIWFFPSSWVSVYCWSSQNGWVKVISRENATTWNFILVLRVVLRQLTKPLNFNRSIEICSQENILKIALDKFILQCNEQLDKYMNYTVSTFLRLWLLNVPEVFLEIISVV